MTYYPAAKGTNYDLNGFWTIQSATAYLDGEPLSGPAVGQAPASALVDSGTPGLVGPNVAIEAFYAALNRTVRTVALADGSYVFQYTDDASLSLILPRLSLSFGAGGLTYEMAKNDLVIGCAPASTLLRLGPEMADLEGTWCLGSLSLWRTV